ncbi:MAG: hypothetical protein ABI402_04925 [Ferruginibacter sp.]
MKPGKIKSNIDPDTLSKSCRTELEIKVKAYTTKELSGIYEIPPRTFIRWISPIRNLIGNRIGQWYTVQQVEIIFSKFGIPHIIREGND